MQLVLVSWAASSGADRWGNESWGELADLQDGNLLHFIVFGCPECSSDKTRGAPLRTVYACLLGEIVFEETIDKQILMDLK